MPATCATLGFPRIGPARELKRALESYWAGATDAAALEAAAADLRRQAWVRQRDHGIHHIPCGDFSLYDHVLDTACMVGAVPERYGHDGGPIDTETYFAMARGGRLRGADVPALEMTKWFDTNYHCLVPELVAGQPFTLQPDRLLGHYGEARDLGITPRPVVLGPLSLLLLAKHPDGAAPLAPLDALVAVYAQLLEQLAAEGAAWVQIDEPVLGLDLQSDVRAAFGRAYGALREAAGGTRILVATYFGGLGGNLGTAMRLPVGGLHLDAVTDPGQLDAAVDGAPDTLALSVGIVDGRNVWRTDLDGALTRLEAVRDRLGPDRVMVAPSCSLVHLPVDLDAEPDLDPELRAWLAFATQRLDELAVLTRGLDAGRAVIAEELADATAALRAREASDQVHNPAVADRLAAVDPRMQQRASPYPQRRVLQRKRLQLPLLPTTTIGSFPQTGEVRTLRARRRRGELSELAYAEAIGRHIRAAIEFQEQAGLDVLVHGEPERNDMVEHFGELLAGCAVTRFGWVQSYGSRCVKPPIIYGDVHRPEPMTVHWSAYAQSLTQRPVKGMLTGPVTILQWSFVRNDQPPEVTCIQIALAVADEVADLEAAGIGVIQVDEPALREGLPLHTADHAGYLDWAVAAFRLATSGAADETQIHTHMCYADFADVLGAIVAFDADVLSLEATRSGMDVLAVFTEFDYPNEIGPGIYDIHSPRVPSTDELAGLLEAVLDVLPAERVWVNPDCGLKTRRWDEVTPALANLVAAAARVRASLGLGSS